MRRTIIALLVLLALLGTAGCGVIDVARNAGEKAAGGEKRQPQDASRPNERAAGGVTQKDTTPETTGRPETTGTSETTGAGSAEEQAQQTGGSSDASGLVLEAKWYKDSDGNVVPDFIEAEADNGQGGDDPYKDDCAPEKCPGAAEGLDFYTQERNALLILDSSGSMAADDGSGTGRTKMDAAKEAISRYSGVSAALFETGFAVYGHTGNATEAGRTQSCGTAAETLLSLGEVDPATFEGTLSRFEPTGWTPIEGALREAEDAFAGKEGQNNRIVLVSDGIETCGGDPVAAARDLQESGIEVQVDVVGFGVPDDETTQLEEIALAGGGEYFDAKTGADLDKYFQKQAEAIGQTYDAFICQHRNSFSDSLCDQEQCQDATVFRIPEEQQKHEPDSPEYRALQDLSDRITAELGEREEAREEAEARADQLYEQYQTLQQEYLRAFDQAYGG